ncbi:MAG: VWA domain-containing protein [archaeon]
MYYPWVLAIVPAAIAVLSFLIYHDFVRVDKKRSKWFFLAARIMIFTALLIAIAGPYQTKEIIVAGDPRLTVLIDNSTSFNLFNKPAVSELIESLEDRIPLDVGIVASGELSAIGDGIFEKLEGGDNILIISDGNNNAGRNLRDIISYAVTLNASVNAVNVSLIYSDASVKINGPRYVIRDSENTFYADVDVAGSLSYTIRVRADNDLMIEERATGKRSFEIKRSFSEGYHKITAELDVNDHFSHNNVYYKSVEALPKPRLLFISQRNSPLYNILIKSLDIEMRSAVPATISELESYQGIILNNLRAGDVADRVDLLSEYIELGKGLLVIGGENAYDSEYKSSAFEALLPVKSTGGKKITEDAINVVVIIDISGSTKNRAGSSATDSAVDVEKAIAVEFVDSLRSNDRIGIIAFNTKSFEISELSKLASKREQVVQKIAALQYGGGTFGWTALDAAGEMLKGQKGARNIIYISDGQDKYTQKAISTAKSISEGLGVKIYTVGVGDQTDEGFMLNIAHYGGTDMYFPIEQKEKLDILFGEPEGNDSMRLDIMNSNHFITRNMDLKAKVYGINTVVPKSSARMLITTGDGKPVLTLWRFGLGRVASLTTDDGYSWAPQLMDDKNFMLMSRIISWVIGNIKSDTEFNVRVNDAYLGETTTIEVESDKAPESDTLSFSKNSDGYYTAAFTPETIGFFRFLDTEMAVNYKQEYQATGMNDELFSVVRSSGGGIFSEGDADSIIQKVKMDSRRKKIEKIFYRWPFVIAAMAVLIIELTYRRIRENRNSYK